MILIELHQTDDLPTVREVAESHFVRLGVVYAHRSGLPLPISVDEAVAMLRDRSVGLWAFYSLDSADLWAETYDGSDAEAIRYAVHYYVATCYAQPLAAVA